MKKGNPVRIWNYPSNCNWKKIKGIKDPEPLDLQTNFKDWSEKHD